MTAYKIKRVYDAPLPDDGFRVLVDRLWPRGISKQQLKADLWLKEIAPSNELRGWFGHDPARFEEFEKRYRHELKDNPALAQLRQIKKPVVTLLFGAKDEEHNQAVVLKKLLNR